MEIKSSLF